MRSLFRSPYASAQPREWRSLADDVPGASAYAPSVQRTLLGALFAVLAVGLALIAIYAALAGGSAWVIALAAGALAAWMGDLSRRALVRRRA